MASIMQRTLHSARALLQSSHCVTDSGVRRHGLEAFLVCPAVQAANHATEAGPPVPAGARQEASYKVSSQGYPPTSADKVLPVSVESSAMLQAAHVGRYYPLDERRIPEAFQQWYSNYDPRPSKTVPIEGGGAIKPLPSFVAGCTGLQLEFAQSQYPYLMYRAAWAAVWEMLLAAEDDSERRLLVKGAPGSGKSVFLAATAEMLRQRGWIVVYVPDCADITAKNMSYSQSQETGMWDTREAAQHILKSVLGAHGEQLKGLQQRVPGGSGTLHDLCSLAQVDSATDAQLCNAVVRLKLELYRLPASTPSAVLLDKYNALFWTTEMLEPQHLKDPRRPRRLDAQELTLGANLRALSDESTGHTAILAAQSVSGSIPRLPLGTHAPDGQQIVELSDVTMPLLDVGELTTMLQWYRFVEAVAPQQAVSEAGVQAAYQLTQGNGNAVRKHLHFLLPFNNMLNDLDTLGEAYTNVSLYRS